jgi:hypothetical protein
VKDLANDLRDQLKALSKELQAYSIAIPLHCVPVGENIFCDLEKY